MCQMSQVVPVVALTDNVNIYDVSIVVWIDLESCDRPDICWYAM